MKIKCYNKKCGHERDYKGQFTEDNSLITCTKCRHKLRLGKAKIDGEVALPHEVTSREVGLKSEVTSLPHAELKEDGPQKEKSFTNISAFNLEVLRKRLEDPQLEETFSIVIKNFNLSPGTQEALQEKERELADPFLNAVKEEPHFDIKVIPIDLLARLKHQQEYGLGVANV